MAEQMAQVTDFEQVTTRSLGLSKGVGADRADRLQRSRSVQDPRAGCQVGDYGGYINQPVSLKIREMS